MHDDSVYVKLVTSSSSNKNNHNKKMAVYSDNVASLMQVTYSCCWSHHKNVKKMRNGGKNKAKQKWTGKYCSTNLVFVMFLIFFLGELLNCPIKNGIANLNSKIQKLEKKWRNKRVENIFNHWGKALVNAFKHGNNFWKILLSMSIFKGHKSTHGYLVFHFLNSLKEKVVTVFENE